MDKCPICNKETVNGVCLDCGSPRITYTHELTGVKPPIILTMNDDIITPEGSAQFEEKGYTDKGEPDPHEFAGVKPPILLTMTDEIAEVEEFSLPKGYHSLSERQKFPK